MSGALSDGVRPGPEFLVSGWARGRGPERSREFLKNAKNFLFFSDAIWIAAALAVRPEFLAQKSGVFRLSSGAELAQGPLPERPRDFLKNAKNFLFFSGSLRIADVLSARPEFLAQKSGVFRLSAGSRGLPKVWKKSFWPADPGPRARNSGRALPKTDPRKSGARHIFLGELGARSRV